MKSRFFFAATIVIVTLLATGSGEQQLSVDERVADLLACMTLEEKVAQLLGIWTRKAEIQHPDGRFNPANAKAVIGNGIGEISRPSEIGGPPGRPVREPR